MIRQIWCAITEKVCNCNTNNPQNTFTPIFYENMGTVFLKFICDTCGAKIITSTNKIDIVISFDEPKNEITEKKNSIRNINVNNVIQFPVKNEK